MSTRPRSTVRTRFVPHLWFASEAVDAANFYVSLFPDSRVGRATPFPADNPSGPAGSGAVVSFTLAGQPFMAISAGPFEPFNHAISFIVNCEGQAELDRLRDGPSRTVARSGSAAGCGTATASRGRSYRPRSARS